MTLKDIDVEIGQKIKQTKRLLYGFCPKKKDRSWFFEEKIYLCSFQKNHSQVKFRIVNYKNASIWIISQNLNNLTVNIFSHSVYTPEKYL